MCRGNLRYKLWSNGQSIRPIYIIQVRESAGNIWKCGIKDRGVRRSRASCPTMLLIYLKPRSHIADLTADLSRPWWSVEVLWSRREVGKDRGWVLEGSERSVNLVEVSPTIPYCFELFKTIGSGRGWRAVVDRSLGSLVRSLKGRYVSVSIVGKGRAWSGRNPGRPSQPTTHDWITSV